MIGTGRQGRVRLEFDLVEANHLLSILMHAKFGDETDIRIVMTPTMRSLLDALFAAYEEAGGTDWSQPGEAHWIIDETKGGTLGPPSFEIIEGHLETEGIQSALDEALYPFKWVPETPRKRSIDRGKVVILEENDASPSQVGVCIQGWLEEESGEQRALVAWAKPDEGCPESVELRTHPTAKLRILY